VLTVAPTFVGDGPTLADGAFPQRRFRLTELGRFGDDGVRLRYERARA
jgi:riboflavin biosynthesis pyrimidine reductase